MRRCFCPRCRKELIRLEPFERGIFLYWCDKCDIDVSVVYHKDFDKKKGGKSK